MNIEPSRPEGAAIIAQLAKAGIKEIVALPDIVTSDGLLWPLSRDASFRLTRICKEDEGISICGAMSYAGKRAILLMQQTGLMDSLNALRAIGMDYGLPVCMLVGLQGKEPGLLPERSAAYGVRIVRPVLDAMGVVHDLIEGPEDVALIAPAIEAAYMDSRPVCLLLGRSPLPARGGGG